MELQKFKDEYMVKVKGGIYKPFFEDKEKVPQGYLAPAQILI